MKSSIFLCVLLAAVALSSADESNTADGWSWVSGSADIGSQNIQSNNSESLVDDILTGKKGRSLDSTYSEVYDDPQVQEALQTGNESSARHYIKERLCHLGLMQVNNEAVWSQPGTMANVSNF